MNIWKTTYFPFQILSFQLRTVDGSEIPFPNHLGFTKKNPVNNGRKITTTVSSTGELIGWISGKPINGKCTLHLLKPLDARLSNDHWVERLVPKWRMAGEKKYPTGFPPFPKVAEFLRTMAFCEGGDYKSYEKDENSTSVWKKWVVFWVVWIFGMPLGIGIGILRGTPRPKPPGTKARCSY